MTRSRLLGSLLLTALLSGCGNASPTGAREGETPDDVRWVGAGGVAVAVPRWWTTGETQCLKPVETTVYVDSGAMTDCEDEPSPQTLSEVSSLAVMDTSQGWAEALLTRMAPAGAVDGRQVLELEGCDPWSDLVCRHVFAVPSAGIAFGVVIADAGDGSVREIRDSLRVLPAGTTTVPLVGDDGLPAAPPREAPAEVVERYGRAVGRAGLRSVVEVASLPGSDAGSSISDQPPGSLLEIDPQPGTPLERGATVTLTVMPRVPRG